jgi:hypothetical protein
VRGGLAVLAALPPFVGVLLYLGLVVWVLRRALRWAAEATAPAVEPGRTAAGDAGRAGTAGSRR